MELSGLKPKFIANNMRTKWDLSTSETGNDIDIGDFMDHYLTFPSILGPGFFNKCVLQVPKKRNLFTE